MYEPQSIIRYIIDRVMSMILYTHRYHYEIDVIPSDSPVLITKVKGRIWQS
jgi:hypothetical protein